MNGKYDLVINFYRTRIESLILSSQISTERVNLGDDSVTLSFDIQLVCTFLLMCIYLLALLIIILNVRIIRES